MIYLLDTSFIVNYFRRKEGWVEKLVALKQKGDLKISLITFAELLYGTFRAYNQENEKEKLEKFLMDLEIETVLLDNKIVEVYAQAKFSLEKKGNKIDDFDLFIGATAIANNAVLVTDNMKHFAKFPRLEVYKESG